MSDLCLRELNKLYIAGGVIILTIFFITRVPPSTAQSIGESLGKVFRRKNLHVFAAKVCIDGPDVLFILRLRHVFHIAVEPHIVAE